MFSMTVRIVMYVTLFFAGIFLVNKMIPEDDNSHTASYVEKADVYIPPQAQEVKSFDAGGLSLATVSLAVYKEISSTSGSSNFIMTSTIGGG